MLGCFKEKLGKIWTNLTVEFVHIFSEFGLKKIKHLNGVFLKKFN